MCDAMSESYAMFDAPDLPPVLAIEETPRGWRGLTAEGELLNVESFNGHPVEIPSGSIAVTRAGRPVGYRALPNKTSPGTIDGYTRCFDAAVRSMRSNRLDLALTSIDTAISFAATTTARFNRALILLSLGKWDVGFEEFELCEREPQFMRPMSREAVVECGLKPWLGQDISGKKLLLVHDHGFGDSIMMLRYVPLLQAVGVEVTLMLPPELRRLAAQIAPVTANSMRVVEADYFCPLLYLFRLLKQTPKSIPIGPYLKVTPLLVEKWKRVQGKKRRKTVGLAWTPGKPYRDGDYARAVPLGALTKALGRDADLVSVQQQGSAEADLLGVDHYQFEDFADCAALMMTLDEVVSIDTAAVHLAGAIGHPRIKLLLPHWSSWRWLSPLYEHVRVYRQHHDGDEWAQVLARLKVS
jgi:hypothetical protein